MIVVELRLIVPPEAVVTPADIAGDHAADDAEIAAIIAAVTEELDGPDGWLGRAIGSQTIDYINDAFPAETRLRLPLPPIVSITSIKYLDTDGEEQTFSSSNYRLSGRDIILADDVDWPEIGSYPDAVRIRYVAGYNDTAVVDGGTGSVPKRILQAIILSTQHLNSTSSENLFLRVDEVDGIGRREYVVSERAGELTRRTADQLLANLRVWS